MTKPTYLDENRVAVTRPPFKPQSIDVTSVLGTTPVYEFDRGSLLALRRTAGATATLTVYASDVEDGTYNQISIDETLLTISCDSDDWIVVNSKIFPFRFLKFVGDDDGTFQLIQKG